MERMKWVMSKTTHLIRCLLLVLFVRTTWTARVRAVIGGRVG